MIKRLKTGVIALGAVTALALGGAAIAGAAQSSPGTDQTPAAQVGDQTAPDQPGSAGEKSSETSSSSDTTASESGPSDGPGGYADTNATADTQQQGEN
jgi:hypothetical protein